MLPERKMGILWTEGYMVSAMCRAQLRSKNKDLMMMISMKLYQLAMVNSVRWYCFMLSREDGHVLRSLDFEI